MFSPTTCWSKDAARAGLRKSYRYKSLKDFHEQASKEYEDTLEKQNAYVMLLKSRLKSSALADSNNIILSREQAEEVIYYLEVRKNLEKQAKILHTIIKHQDSLVSFQAKEINNIKSGEEYKGAR